RDRETCIVVPRQGKPEELYVSCSYGPLRDGAGAVRGVFCTCTDDTERVLERRRWRTLQRLAGGEPSRSAAQVGERVVAALAENPRDVRFVGLYLLDEAQQAATLVASHGLAEAAPAAPERVALHAPA